MFRNILKSCNILDFSRTIDFGFSTARYDERMSDDQSKTIPDALIVAARNDREAFGQLFEAYYERILHYCLRRLYERSLAEDVCSEVFLYVAGRMRSFRGSTEQDFRRWIYRIATTEINATIRRTQRHRQLWNEAIEQNRISPKGYDEPTQAETSYNWHTVFQALGQLSEREQTLLTLRLYEELPFEEIAGILKIRTGAARVIYSRAIKKLRERLTVTLIEPNCKVQSDRVQS